MKTRDALKAGAWILAIAAVLFFIREFGSDAASGFMDGLRDKPPQTTPEVEQGD